MAFGFLFHGRVYISDCLIKTILISLLVLYPVVVLVRVSLFLDKKKVSVREL